MSVLVRLLCAFALLLGSAWSQAALSACTLRPLAEQWQLPSVRAAEPQRSAVAYRGQVLRYAKGFYGALAQNILHGEGEYLDALQQLMGSEGDACLYTYRQMLLQEVDAQDFALALWAWRAGLGANASSQVSTAPAQDWGAVTVEQQ